MKTGELVADFELPDQDGVARTLSEFLEKGPVVLFFYPAGVHARAVPRRAATSVTWRRSSRPSVPSGWASARTRSTSSTAFAEKYAFDYPLLSDEDRRVAAAFGVKRALPLLPNRRATFVIGTDRRVLRVIASEVNMAKHADLALETLGAQRDE